MGIFSNLLGNIWGHAPEAPKPPAPAPAAAPAPVVQPVAASAPAAITAAPAAAAAQVQALHTATETTAATTVHVVDVEAILDGLAAKNTDNLDWRHSIVDLMALVGMDHSLTSRKELAHELGYTGSTTDTATMNMWLHKEVLTKIAMNGGKVPQDLLT